MSIYKPPFKVTSKIINLISDISNFIGKYEGLTLPHPKVELRRENKIKTVQGSVSIEGNTLTIAQITDILDGKRIIGSQKEIIEVKNAISVYERIKEFNTNSIVHFCKAHKILMEKLIPDAGKFRAKDVGILKHGKISHIAPKPKLVKGQIEDLFAFINKDIETHPLIKSSVTHYEIEFIHPFSDGNGRIGRFWEHAMLTRWHSLFEFISIESIIKKRQEKYYKALEISDKKGSSEEFIGFILESILESLDKFFLDLKVEPLTSKDRLTLASEKIKEKPFTRKDYINVFKTISTATASRDLRFGVETKLLKKSGDKRNTIYCFK